ncbi:MAG: hypothetical protein K0S61_3056 [Anaerocolumna sp.]|nr:hypothetical protein [Anaerocolumna sp.]
MILIRLFKQMPNGWGLIMKNTLEKVLWGVILVLFGVALAGKVLGLFHFNVFFPGWWTLFIIIPSAVSLISGNNIASSIGGLAVGFMLLMTQTGNLSWQEFSKMLIAVVLVTLGFSFIFPDNKNHNKSNWNEKKDKDYSKYQKDGFNTEENGTKTGQSDYVESEYRETSDDTSQHRFHENMNGEGNSFVHDNEKDWMKDRESSRNNYSEDRSNINEERSNQEYRFNEERSNQGYRPNEERNGHNNSFRQYTGFFSVQKEQFVDEVFGGAVINAILGGVELDLRNAIFSNDTIIDITCIMGGVDIFVPTNMKVVVNCTPIMGGVDCYVKNLNNQAQNQYTLFIKGTCLMGGVEIK